jgi:molybdate transport system substrate-binding protein
LHEEVRRRLLCLVAALALPGVAACGRDGGDGGQTTLRVFAASSLSTSFQRLASDFEADHDGVSVELSSGGSSDLVAQIQEGAPADVFASADTANMDKLTGAGLEGQQPQDFASNTLEIVTPPDNPAGIATFADLARTGLDLVVCAPEVPCGAAALRVAEVAGVTLEPVSEEQSVADVLAKVISGEADAGLVYVTDVKGAGDAVLGIPFPESGEVVNTYPITTIKDSSEPELAREFVDLVLSDAGQSVLRDAGFAETPPA